MKQLRILGLTVAAVTALLVLAGAGTASATVLCKNKLSTSACSEDYAAGTEIKGELTGKLVFHGFVNYECSNGSFSGKTESTGGSNLTVKWPIGSLSQSPCTGCTLVLRVGSMEVHHISGTNNGTVTSSGTELTQNCETIFGKVHCVYKSESTDIGILEGGSPARLFINGTLQIVPTNELCNWRFEEGEGIPVGRSEWTAEYTITSPKPLYVTAG